MKDRKMDFYPLSFILLPVFCFLFSVSYSFCDEPFQYAEGSQALSFDPLRADDTVSLRLTSLLFNSLVGTNIDLQPQADLLKSLKPEYISEDGLTYRFRLKEKVKWHCCDKNGKSIEIKEFDATDVRYSFLRVKNNAAPTLYDFVLNVFDDCREVKESRYLVDLVLKPAKKGIPLSLILRYMTFRIVPNLANIASKDADNCVRVREQTVIGTGTYAIFLEAGDSILLNRYNAYHGRSQAIETNLSQHPIAPIDRIAMSRYRDDVTAKEELTISGKPRLHMITNISADHYAEMRANPDVSLEIHGTNNFTYFAYNCSRPPFNDKRVRQAFTYAVDLRKMLINVYGHIYTGITGLTPLAEVRDIRTGPLPSDESDPKILPVYDPILAKSLLQRAGFTSITLTLKPYIERSDQLRICQDFINQVKQNLGITVQLEPMTKSRWKEEVIVKRDFQIAFGQWSFNEGANIIQSLFSSESSQAGGKNFVFYKNPQLQELLERYERENSPEIRVQLKHRMHKIIYEDSPYTFLFSLPKWSAFRSDVLRGVEIHPYYFFSFINQWYMVRKAEGGGRKAE